MTGRTHGVPPGYLPLGEAAQRAGKSVRTVLRWIEEGRVATAQHPAQHRRRLVEIASLDRAAHAVPEPTTTTATPTEHEVDHEAVLAAVRGLSQQTGLTAAGVGIRLHEVPDEELLQSPFATWLWVLINAVRGKTVEPPETIQQAITNVLRTAYTDPFTGRVVVADEFWRSTLIGRHMARAQLLLHPARDLVSLRQIVGSVGLPRLRVANTLEAIGAERLYDPDEGRWVYPRHVITAVQSREANQAAATLESAEVPGDHQARHSQSFPATVDTPSVENRVRIRAVRDAYHRRYFRAPGQ